MNQSTNIIISGGGTGGHLFPALALGDEILKIDSKINIHYVGSLYGIEKDTLPNKNLTHTLLPISGLNRQISFTSIWKNLVLPYRIIKSKRVVKKLFNLISPKLVIGTGGYASALPLSEGIKRKIPTIIQEQNAFPGITTRWFSNNVSKIFIAFNEAQEFIDKKCILSGNPVRTELNKGSRNNSLKKFSLNGNKKIILIFGGSQGSLYLNNITRKILDDLYNLDIQLIWQTGPKLYQNYKDHQNDLVKVIPFIDNMADAYAASDLVISRSGAITCSEITYCGKPSILFPFKASAGDHQTKNAESLSKKGAAIVFKENEIDDVDLIHTIKNLMSSNDKLEQMSNASLKLSLPNAVKQISLEAIRLIQNV